MSRHPDGKKKEKRETAVKVLYHVVLVRSAEKEMLKLREPSFTAVATALHALSDNPRPGGSAKLTSRTEFKLRIGDLRIIYEIDDKAHEVLVLIIDDRKQVYRKLKRR